MCYAYTRTLEPSHGIACNNAVVFHWSILAFISLFHVEVNILLYKYYAHFLCTLFFLWNSKKSKFLCNSMWRSSKKHFLEFSSKLKKDFSNFFNKKGIFRKKYYFENCVVVSWFFSNFLTSSNQNLYCKKIACLLWKNFLIFSKFQKLCQIF